MKPNADELIRDARRRYGDVMLGPTGAELASIAKLLRDARAAGASRQQCKLITTMGKSANWESLVRTGIAQTLESLANG